MNRISGSHSFLRLARKMRIMPTLSASLLLLLLSPISAANNSRFDANTALLEINCAVILEDDSEYDPNSVFGTAVTLRFNGEVFELLSLGIGIGTSTTPCTATFDPETGILHDEVRLKDEVYDLSLALQSDDTLSIQSAEFLRIGTTSLWRVSDGNNEVIIGGTIHVLQEDDFPVPALYLNAFEETDILVTEITGTDLAELSDQERSLLFSENGTTLGNLLSAEVLSRATAFFQPRGFFLLPSNTVRPTWLANDISFTAITDKGFGSGVDSFFISQAAERGIPNSGLETGIDQFNAINQSNSHLTADQIITEALDSAEDPLLEASLQRLVAAWREGDEKSLIERALLPLQFSDEAGYQAILVNRNSAWTPQIEAMLATPERELVLVGVAHLVGADSVLQMLRDLGYTVERVQP